MVDNAETRTQIEKPQDRPTKAGPLLFLVAGACFFLPFFHVSCSGQRLVSVTGFQLVTGAKMKESLFPDPRQTRDIKPEPLAIGALFSILAAAATGLLRSRRAAAIPGILGLVGLSLLFMLKRKLNAEVETYGQGLLDLETGDGFVGSAILGVAGSLFAWLRVRRGSASVLGHIASSGGWQCPKCGSFSDADARFCPKCGSRRGDDFTSSQEH